jgi:hypothetical protein
VIAGSGRAAARGLITSANFNDDAQRHAFEAGWLVAPHPLVPPHP